jgi:hypothetical protein
MESGIKMKEIYIVTKEERKKRAKVEMVAGIVALVFIGIFGTIVGAW